MTLPGPSLSSWASTADLPAEVLHLHSPAQWAAYLGTATDILWAATGRRWLGAALTATVALRAAPPRAGEGSWPYHPSWGHCPCYAGIGVDGPRWAAEAYRHAAPASVRLPRPDVVAVTSVLLDGAAFTGWRLDGSWLARVDGGTWPVCGDRTTVSYTFGRPPPAAGVRACVELAVELGRAGSSDPDQPCQLPKRLQSVTRQGISYVALDAMEFMDKGLTGLYAVDLFLRAVNPHGRAQAGSVWSPDISRAQRRP